MALARLQLRRAPPGDPAAADRALRVLCGICGLPYLRGWQRRRAIRRLLRAWAQDPPDGSR